VIEFTCRYCGEAMEAPDSLQGEKLDCPACKHKVSVPRQHDQDANEPKKGTLSGLCSSCLKGIPPKATKCPHCGVSLKTTAAANNPSEGSVKSDQSPEPEPANLIKFKCSKCGADLEASQEQRGQAVQCPQCGLHEKVPKSLTLFAKFRSPQ